VINEVMYHPPDAATNDNTLDEYIELFNPLTTPANLFDTNGAWRIAGGVGFTFPPNTVLAPGGYLLVVNFDPADAAALDTFRARYGVTNSSLPVFGPYSGKLGNRSDRVSIEKPQYPDLPGDSYSWVIVDEVIYGNQAPWPAVANGTGASLQRTTAGGSGANPANWTAAAPSPGRGTVPDRDGDGMPDDWEIAHQLNPDYAGDAALDPDQDGFSNLQEYLAGTDPHDSASLLSFEPVAVRNGAIVLQFTQVAGKSYSVLYRDSFSGGAWLKLKDVPPSSITTMTEVVVAPPVDSRERYYRLVTPTIR